MTIGSGRLVFEHFHEVGSFAPPDGFLPQYSSAVMYAQNFVTRQLGDELHFADSPSFLFGGPYEAAIHTSNGFQLLENTTFLFWQVNIGEERIAVLNFTLINQYYRAKKLVVEVCKLSTQSPHEHRIEPTSIYEIGTKKSRKSTPTSRHYVPQNICNYVFLSDNRYDHTVSCQVPVKPTGDFIEYRSLDSGEEYILIHDNWYKQLEYLMLPIPEGKLPDFPYK